MAKNSKVTSDGVNKELLSQIVSGAVTFISQADGLPMLNHVPPLIEVNTGMVQGDKAACRATEAATAYLAANPAATAPVAHEASKYAILTGVALPEAKKRGNTSGSGAPTKYPFADLPVGGTFFSANSEHAKGDAVKALGSTVSSQNNKYSEPTGEKKTVTRAVRDPKTHKAVLDAQGNKVTETVELDVKKYSRRFTIRPVAKGYQSGSWTAPEDGALIGRVE